MLSKCHPVLGPPHTQLRMHQPHEMHSLDGLVNEGLDWRRPPVAHNSCDASTPLDKQVVVQVVLEAALWACKQQRRQHTLIVLAAACRLQCDTPEIAVPPPPPAHFRRLAQRWPCTSASNPCHALYAAASYFQSSCRRLRLQFFFSLSVHRGCSSPGRQTQSCRTRHAASSRYPSIPCAP